MRLIFIISIFALFLQAQNVLVINSSSKVKKYNETLEAFSKSYTKEFKTIDISTMNESDIKEYLYDEYPDVVYAVGAKAYQYANKYLPEKTIYFSSIVNWKRLPMRSERFGVSNELHSGMQLTLIKSIFSDMKTIGIVYSKYTQDIVDDFTLSAKEFGIEIIAKKIDEESITSQDFFTIIDESQAIIIIPDPIFLSDEKGVADFFEYAKDVKKPVFAYHRLFINYGAVMVSSVDNPTIGRQIASMIESCADETKTQNIRYPAGTKVIFNKKEVDKMELKYSSNILFLANEIVE